jgi:hypothetical protein
VVARLTSNHRVNTDESANTLMLLEPAVSSWETWRWGGARAMLRGSSTSLRHHAERSPTIAVTDACREARRS